MVSIIAECRPLTPVCAHEERSVQSYRGDGSHVMSDGTGTRHIGARALRCVISVAAVVLVTGSAPAPTEPARGAAGIQPVSIAPAGPPPRRPARDRVTTLAP